MSGSYLRRCLACGTGIDDLPRHATRCSPCHGAKRRQDDQAQRTELDELRAEVARLRALVARLQQGGAQ